MKIYIKTLVYIILIVCFFSFKLTNNKNNKPMVSYEGWWIFGDSNHLFKDQNTLKEISLVFMDYNENDINELYLSIAKMEYFPIECYIRGIKKIDLKKNELYFSVQDFEILYVEGCGEN